MRIPCHFGELIQGRLGADGPVALVTLPCPALGLRAWAGGRDRGVHDAGARLVAPDRLARLFAALGVSRPARRVILRASVAPGLGTGLSTAALIGAAQVAGWRGQPEALAAACLAAEGASDPLMFATPGRLLWASRQGRVLARRGPLPRLSVVGGIYGPPRRTDPQDDHFPDISDLAAAWQRAPDAPTLAALARDSAVRTLALRGPAGDPTADLARDLGALGWQIAHTGAARGLIFSPGTVPRHAPAALREAGLRGILRFEVAA